MVVPASLRHSGRGKGHGRRNDGEEGAHQLAARNFAARALK